MWGTTRDTDLYLGTCEGIAQQTPYSKQSVNTSNAFKR